MCELDYYWILICSKSLHNAHATFLFVMQIYPQFVPVQKIVAAITFEEIGRPNLNEISSYIIYETYHR